MSHYRRRSSHRISLVLIGSVAVTAVSGCSKQETRRDIYASKEACLADWGNTPKDCEPAYEHPGSRGPNTYYYGRRYPYTGNSNAFVPRSPRSVGTTTVSRGGFGSSAHSASSTGG